MRSLSRYILFQTLGPWGFFALVLTVIIWLTQSLRMLDLVINKGQSAGTFLHLTLLVLPSLLAIILPVAFFCAVLYVIHRLYSDSELVVMWASGVSRWDILRPLFVAAGLMAALTLAINLFVMPLGMRSMKDKVFEIRADLATTLVKEGAFTTPLPGLTVYIKQSARSGELTGILVHDSRDETKPITYMAAKGVLARTPEGPRLVMYDGNIQRSEQGGAQISVLDFEKYTFDLSAFEKPRSEQVREASERYIDELFTIDQSKPTEVRLQDVFAAEGHNRLATPLYNFVFVFIAGAFLIASPFSRRGQGWKIAAAAACGIAARLAGFGLQGLAGSEGMLWPLIYLNPILWIAGSWLVIARAGTLQIAPQEQPA